MSSNSEKPDWDGTEVEVSITATFRYKLNAGEDNLAYGPGVETLEQAMAIDMANFKADPAGTLALESLYNEIDYMASWRVV